MLPVCRLLIYCAS